MEITPFNKSSLELEEQFARYVHYIWGRHAVASRDEVLEVHSLPQGAKFGSPTSLAYVTAEELIAGADDVIARAWDQGHTTYIGCIPLDRNAVKERLAETGGRGRGKKSERGMITWAWADIDLALPGGIREGHVGARGRFCQSVEEGMSVVAWAGLPEPTFWVFSGSGLYPGWALRVGAEVDSHGKDAGFVAWVSARLSSAAAERGIHVDRVGDLTRVLRPVGTANWKSGEGVRVARIEWSGQEYDLPELGWTEDKARTFVPTTRTTAEKEAILNTFGKITREPMDGVSWDEILGSRGWERVDDGFNTESRWRRPGATSSSSCAVYGDAPDWLVVFSDAVGLPTNIGGLNKWRTWAWLWFEGDTGAAWNDMVQVASGAGGSEAPWPKRVIEHFHGQMSALNDEVHTAQW